MRENRDFVVPVNILTTFAHAPFSWAARHTTVCLDQLISNFHISKMIKVLKFSGHSSSLRNNFSGNL